MVVLNESKRFKPFYGNFSMSFSRWELPKNGLNRLGSFKNEALVQPRRTQCHVLDRTPLRANVQVLQSA